MSKETEGDSNLKTVLDFAEKLSGARFEAILAASDLDEAGRQKALSQYRQVIDNLKSFQDHYQIYEREQRGELKAFLDKLWKLLHEGPEHRAELLAAMQQAAERAALVNPLDAGLMKLLASIWPDACSPELLKIFINEPAPWEFDDAARQLQKLYAEKSGKEKEIFSTAFLAVKPDIEAAAKKLNEQKADFEALARSLHKVSEMLAFMNKALGYAKSVI